MSHKKSKAWRLTKDDIMSALYELEQKVSVPSNSISKISEDNNSPLRFTRHSRRSTDTLARASDHGEHNYLIEPRIRSPSKGSRNSIKVGTKQELNNSFAKQSNSPKKSTTSDIENRKRSHSPINEIVNRLYKASPDREHKLTALRLEKLYSELKGLKPKPEMSPGSKKMLESKTMKPIYERSHDILKKKEDKVFEIRRMKEAKEKDGVLYTDVRLHTGKSRSPEGEKTRSSKEFTDDVYLWYAKKQAIQQAKHFEKIAKETANLSFHPALRKKSQQLVQKTTPDEPVEDRLLRAGAQQERRIQALIEKHTPSFKPVLNNRTTDIYIKNQAKRSSQGMIDTFYVNTGYDAPLPEERARTPI